jgi:hypothetical protein
LFIYCDKAGPEFIRYPGRANTDPGALEAFTIIFWKTFLKKMNSKLSDETIKATYRPLIISLLMYEFLLARNLPGLLLN